MEISDHNDSKKITFPSISTPVAAAIYVVYSLIVYWPVLLKHRFFWEDFMSQEYPLREFSFYMAGLHHVLPFWNPYSWGWEPILADPQNGFWYPLNLLQIGFMRLILPSTTHLPILVPEIVTIFHLPIAALGLYFLLKQEFHLSEAASLLAGFAWGFSARMAAEQNHAIFLIPLSLLPWATVLLMRGWSSWKYCIGLGILWAMCFFGSHPEAFFFLTIFLTLFTLAEIVRRWRQNNSWKRAILPLVAFALAMAVTVGVSAIQLLPSEELTTFTAREHLSYAEASVGSVPIEYFGGFIVPKFFGENPGFLGEKSPFFRDVFWWWEGTWYWGVLPEILALFAIIALWRRRSSDLRARYLIFFVVVAILSVIYSLGKYAYLQEFCWRFLPLFHHFRAPQRMMWVFMFVGTILSGIGLDLMLEHPDLLRKYVRFFFIACALFLFVHLIAMAGIFDRLLHKHRPGLWLFLLSTFLASLGTSTLIWATVKSKISRQWIFPIAAILIIGDLFYLDATWYRNSINQEQMVTLDSTTPGVQRFRKEHSNDHAKLFWELPDSIRKWHSVLGLFLRTPVEYILDGDEMRNLNPLRLNDFVPPTKDTLHTLQIMGVTNVVDSSGVYRSIAHSLPFVKLYHDWQIAWNDTQARRLLNDTGFHIDTTVYLDLNPSIGYSQDTHNKGDTAIVSSYSENSLSISVHTTSPAILLVNDLYYPAWKATMDGKKAEVMRAFSSLRAITVPAGIHTVELHYDDDAFNWGWKISLATLLASLVIISIPRKQKDSGT